VWAHLPSIERREPSHVVGQAGTGEALVELNAGGDLWVHVQSMDREAGDGWQTLDSIAARIEAEIATHLDRMSLDSATQHEIDRAIHQAEKELARAQRHFHQETRRAQERAQRAQELAARAARRAQERIARASRSWAVTFDTGAGLFGPRAPHPSDRSQATSASAEEQLAILKMLQESKITVEEAEQLLKALEG
jgi:hypothetical protein